MEKNSSLFTIARHVNRNYAFQNRTKNKCNDYVIYEKLEAFQQNKAFLKIDIFGFFFFNAYMKKERGHIMDRLHEWEFATNLSSSELEKCVNERQL